MRQAFRSIMLGMSLVAALSFAIPAQAGVPMITGPIDGARAGSILLVADKQCEAQKKSCLASCEGLSNTCGGFLCSSPRQKCRSQCSSIRC